MNSTPYNYTYPLLNLVLSVNEYTKTLAPQVAPEILIFLVKCKTVALVSTRVLVDIPL